MQAYCYLGLDVLAQDKCGEAISCLRESNQGTGPQSLVNSYNPCMSLFLVVAYAATEKLSREYSSMKGPGTHARPQEHVFFRKLGPLIKSTLEKCEHENGFM